MSIADLIDYLGQFEGDARVFLTKQDVEDSLYLGDFIVLEELAFGD